MKPNLIFSLCLWAIFSLAPCKAQVDQIVIEGFLDPYQEISISPIITGTIASVDVKQGQYVTKDQPLLTLDSKELLAEYQIALANSKAEGTLKAATASRDLQMRQYTMKKKLLGRSVNDAEIQREYAELMVKEGELITTKEQLRIATLEANRILTLIEKRTITSPIDGYVDKINRDIGESVGPGQNRNAENEDFLIKIDNLSQLKATFFFPYKSVKTLKEGDQIEVISSDDDDPWKAIGIIEFLSRKVNAATATVEVKIVIPNKEGRYKSGVPAKVLLPAPSRN